jgi:hypothetical protein
MTFRTGIVRAFTRWMSGLSRPYRERTADSGPSGGTVVPLGVGHATTSADLAAMQAAVKVATLIQRFFEQWDVSDDPAVERSLDERGLQSLSHEYVDTIAVLRGIPRIESEVHSPFDMARARKTLMAGLACPSDKMPTREIIQHWATRVVPRFQLLLEAMPRELGGATTVPHRGLARRIVAGDAAGDSGLEAADILSEALHSLARKVYLELGEEYYPVRLYRDTLECSSAQKTMLHTQQVRPYDYSRALCTAGIDVVHGTIVRVRRPTVRHTAAADTPLEWEGILEYADVPKPPRTTPT